MLQLTPSPQRNDSLEMFNPKLRSQNHRLANLMHQPAAIVPGMFMKQSIPEPILPFETIDISSPNICQSSKQELTRINRIGRRRQNSLRNRQHSFPQELTSPQNQNESTNSPQSNNNNAIVTPLSKSNSWDYSKRVTPHPLKYIIESDSAYQSKPISKSLLLQLELHLEQEDDEEFSQPNEVLSVSQHQVEQQQFKDLRQSTSQLQKESQSDQSNIEIQLFSPSYSISKRVIITSKESFVSDTRTSKVKQLLSRKAQLNTTLKMLITKDTQAFNALWPQYYLKFAQNERALMAAKLTSNLSNTYIISTTPRDFQENSGYYLGKIKSNDKGNVFNVYGPGLNPKNAQSKHVIPRQLIATVAYQDNKGSAFRQFKLYIKKEQCHYYLGFPQVKMYGEQMSLDSLYLHFENRQKIDFYSNNIELESDKQENMGRSQHVSNKSNQNNVVLEHSLTREEAVVLQNINSSTSNLSISTPISPLIGFALGLISFNAKP